jgi:hypothetical protein
MEERSKRKRRFMYYAMSRGGASSDPAPADFTVTNDAELTAAISSATNGQIIELTDTGTFTARASLNSKTGVTLRGETSRGPLLEAGITAISTTNCTIKDLRIRRLAPDTNANYGSDYVIDTGSSSGLTIENCEIYSNTMSTITMQYGTSAGTYLQCYSGIGEVGLLRSTNITIRNNTIHDCAVGSILTLSGANNYVEGNLYEDIYRTIADHDGEAGAYLYFRNNDCIGIWASDTDTGAPHTSTFAIANNSSPVAQWGACVTGNKFISDPSRRFAVFGTYGQGSGPKFNGSTVLLYTNCIFAYNIVAAEISFGLEISFGDNFQVHNNTIVKDMFSPTGSTASFNHHDVGPGSSCCKNIFTLMDVGTDAGLYTDEAGSHADWYANSYDNFTARPNGLFSTVTGDVICYDQVFAGPTYTGLTLANIVDRLTPKAGSIVESKGMGAIGTGYDWTTRANVATPSYTKPKTTNATGVTPALTQFDGTNDWLQMNVTAPFLDFSNNTAVTMAIYNTFDAADTVNSYFAQSVTADYSIRKLPTSSKNAIRIDIKNSAGATILQLQTSFKFMAADGSNEAKRLFLITFNAATGEFYLMRGKEIDPFPNIVLQKTGTLSLARTAHGIMGQSDTSPPTGSGLTNGRFGLFYMTDAFIDLSVAANHNGIAATDGKPADWGANGSNVTGTQPRGFVKGDATALNAGGGINLGSSPDKWIMTGAVVDA